MARYDLHPDPDRSGCYLLDVQTDLLTGLNTRVVVPVMLPDVAPRPARRLNPAFQIGGTTYVMVTQFISAIPDADLRPRVSSLQGDADAIKSALDMLTDGF
jgi:toxin CcdB